MGNTNEDTRLHGVVFSLVIHVLLLLFLLYFPLQGQDGGNDSDYVVLVDNRGMDKIAQAKPKRQQPKQKNDKIATAAKAQPKAHQKKVEKIHKEVAKPTVGKSYKTKANEGVKKETPKVNNKKTTDVNSVKKEQERKKKQEEERRRQEEIKKEKLIKKRRQDSIRRVQEVIKKKEEEAKKLLQNIMTTAQNTKKQEQNKQTSTTQSSSSSNVSAKSSRHKGLSMSNRVFVSGAPKPSYLGNESGTIYLNLTVNPIGQVSKVTVNEGYTTITNQRTIDSAIAFVKTLKFNSVGNNQYDHGFYKLTYKNGGFY